ncbi:peptidase M24, structural domain-containing protein [Chytriomyces sp. MP71]|nr:peptidase M24, structural domain-containing protein [Chytriomyces sp. MP71]
MLGKAQPTHNQPPTRKAAAASLALTFTVATALFLLHLSLETPNYPATLANVCPFEQPNLSQPIFHSTRPRLFKALESVLAAGEILVIPSAPRILQAESDSEYMGWKQTANVKYLLDHYSVGGGVVTISRANDLTLNSPCLVSLYLPIQTERDDIFMGSLPSKEELRRDFGIDNVSTVDELPLHLSTAVKESKNVISTVQATQVFASLPATVVDRLTAEGVEIQFSSQALQAFYEARFIKTDQEFARLVFASKLAHWVHKNVELYISRSKEVTEIEIFTEFIRLSALCGGDLQSYPPIVGAGMHGATLHYRTGNLRRESHAKIQPGSFVLVDAAPEFAGYTSDLTRTYVRGGSGKRGGLLCRGQCRLWTPQMKEVYGIVERVQQRFIDSFELGADWAAINSEFVVDITRELVNAEFIIGVSLEDAVQMKAYSIFMPHGLGHPVGLEVHDPTPNIFVEEGIKFLGNTSAGFDTVNAHMEWIKKQKPQLHNAAVANYKISRGHITTVEPGIYFIPKLLESVKKEARGECINWDKIEQGGYLSLGGVRIEDIVMFGHDGKKRIITRE